MAGPMLLEGVAHADAGALGRWGTDARIDALPYVDVEEGDWKPAVEQLLKEEMRRSQKSVQDYLADLPPVPPSMFTADSLIGQELARVESNTPLPPLDQTRFRLEPPPLNRRNDVNAWKAALANARAQLEHQGLRMTNLELLYRYGSNAWKAHINHLEASAHISDAMLQENKTHTDAVNQERKLQQEAVGKDIQSMQKEWGTLVQKNMDIATECKKLEAEIAELQQEEDAATKVQQEKDAATKLQQEEDAATKLQQEEDAATKLPQEEDAATKVQQEEDAATKLQQEEDAAASSDVTMET